MPTLTINGGILLGSPQVQPTQGAFQPITLAINAGSLPALETPISVPRTIINVGPVPSTPSPSTTTFRNIMAAAGAPEIVLSTTPASVNVITPSYSLTLEPGAYDASRLDPTVFTTKRFEPYEQLTGISQERPEIIMLTSFLPLFIKDTDKTNESIHQVETNGYYSFMTPAGRYIDAQLQARNMLSMNMVGLLTRLREHFSYLDSTFINRQQSFSTTIDTLTDTTAFLLSLIKGMNKLKEQLDLRDDLFDVDPQAVARNQMLNGTKIANVGSIESVLAAVRRFLPLSYTLIDALVALGFTSDAVRSVFSSTKIWLQMMLDLKIMLQAHSLEFVDIDPSSRRNDVNAASILRDDVKRFGLSQNILVPELSGITSVSTADLHNVVSLVNLGFQSIYEDSLLKSDEIKIAALVNLISKEFNYSSGLSQPSMQRVLSDGFGFNVVPNDNRTLFNAVLGQVGTGISDVPATETNSLASLAQRQLTNNEIVLTFESKYIVGDAGTLTPGSRFFIDSVLKTDGTKFNTERLDELANHLQGSYDRFNAIVNGLNLLAQGFSVEADNKDFRLILGNQSDFLNYLLSQIVNVNTGETSIELQNDNLSSIYAQAQKNNELKAILFVYTMCRIARSYHVNTSAVAGAAAAVLSSLVPTTGGNAQIGNVVQLVRSTLQSDNTPVTDALIERLLTVLRSTVSESGELLSFSQTSTTLRSLTTVKRGTPTGGNISFDAIRTALKHGSPLTRIIETVMSKILTTFRADEGALINNKTRFGGDADTTIMMVVFDLIITLFAKFNNQTIVAFLPASAAGVDSLRITKMLVNHIETIRDLTTRLNKEITLIRKLTYATLNAMKNLASTTQSFSSYLQSPQSVQKLKDIATVFSDSNLLQMLFSEQQIMMLASTVYDLKSNIKRRTVNNGNDEFLVLDNSNLTPELQQALYGLLSNTEFTVSKGFNKKILTVGIPLGFSKHLQQSVKLNNLKKTSFVNKQNDIVSVVVYKTDLKNPDVVYKPQRFLFELSRFPARGQQGIQNIPTNPTIDEVVNAIPTRDFNQSLKSGYDPVYGAVTGDPIVEGFKAAFTDEAYSFLTDAQKAEIIRNHVVSYIMEVYISLFTGINVADYHFDIVTPAPPVEPDFIKTLTEHRVKQVVDIHSTARTQVTQGNTTVAGRTGGILFSSTIQNSSIVNVAAAVSKTTNLSNTSGIAGVVDAVKQFEALKPTTPTTNINAVKRIVEQAETNLSSVSQRQVPGLVTDMQLINGFARTITSMADGLSISKRLLQPKQFDRVFNVIIDPDNFQIDYDSTVKTPYGKQALQQMITNGDVIPEDQNNQIFRRVIAGRPGFSYGQRVSIAGSRLYRDRDKVPGDMAFEKYFVTIETLDESEQV